jgi:hypothetical protein
VQAREPEDEWSFQLLPNHAGSLQVEKLYTNSLMNVQNEMSLHGGETTESGLK